MTPRSSLNAPLRLSSHLTPPCYSPQFHRILVNSRSLSHEVNDIIIVFLGIELTAGKAARCSMRIDSLKNYLA
jgi:hypothetical protein